MISLPAPPAGTQIVVHAPVQVEAHRETLLTEYPQDGVMDLIHRKRTGREKESLTPSEAAAHTGAKSRLEAQLTTARDQSQLRETPEESTRKALHDLLIRLRLG